MHVHACLKTQVTESLKPRDIGASDSNVSRQLGVALLELRSKFSHLGHHVSTTHRIYNHKLDLLPHGSLFSLPSRLRVRGSVPHGATSMRHHLTAVSCAGVVLICILTERKKIKRTRLRSIRLSLDLRNGAFPPCRMAASVSISV